MEVVSTVNQSKVIFFPEERAILMRFEGDMSDEEYKGFWTQAIDYAEANLINRVIIDQQNIGNVSFNARGWVVIHGFPRVKKALPSSLAAAILSSKKVVQKTGMQYLLKAFRTMTGLKVELQPSEEEALAYLITANKLEEVPA
jgi:hypothetical protein